ncbi:putative tail length tape measure protein [Prevotella sp. CAG:1031]|nr:putative tail length tape measure protein [Prevotella sp. CAG:1031]
MMAEVARLQVVIGARINEFNKEMGALQKNVKRTFASDNLGINKGALGVIAGVGVALGALGLASVKAAGQMEQTRIAFTTLLKDGEKAKSFLSELEKFAASTPFELPGVLDASKRLLAFGFSAEQVIPILTAVGDSAAALGIGEEGIQRLTLAIGQMQAKGKVSAEEMLQLAEAGVPAWEMLANKIGTDIPTAMDKASKGQISAAEGIQAVISGMNSKFGGMMEQQAQTVNGIMSNIQDSVTQSMVVIGDKIIEAFDIKPKLKGAQDALGEFTEKVKSIGLADAIREIPSGFAGSMAVIAGAALGVAIPAIVALVGTMGTLAVGAGIISAPVIALGAVVGGVAYAMFENWDWLSEQWDMLCNAMSLATGRMGAYIQKVLGGIIYYAGVASSAITKAVGGTPEISAEMTEHGKSLLMASDVKLAEMDAQQMMFSYRPDIEPVKNDNKPVFQNADVNNLGIGGNTAAGIGKTGSKAAGIDKISREIDRINEKLNSAKEKTLDMQRDFNEFAVDIKISGLSEFEQVYANIAKEGILRMNSVDEWKNKFANATAEAQQLYERAMKTGDANVIANALAMLEERKAAEITAAEEAKNAKAIIEKEYTEEIMSQATLAQAYKAELDEASKQGDLERYIAYLDEEKAAFLQSQAEKQEAMQLYQDWRMEAEESFASFSLEAIDTLKQGFASSFANAITNSDNLGKSLQNLGKQILNMFIQWKANQLMSQGLLKTGILENVAMQVAAGKTIAAGTREAALYANMLSGGTLAPLAATSITTALGTLSALSSAGAGGSFKGTDLSGYDFGESGLGKKTFPFAAGGVVTAPTHALIGEKSYPEAVLPLSSSVLQKITSFLFDGVDFGATSGDGANVEIINYGDINTGADYDTFMEDIQYSLAMGVRG